MTENNNHEIIEMKCADCGGLYRTVDDNILKCPYCGSVKVILDSDAVKIAKARFDAYKEVELERIQKEHERLTPKELTHEQKVFLLIILAAIFLLLGLCTYAAFRYESLH